VFGVAIDSVAFCLTIYFSSLREMSSPNRLVPAVPSAPLPPSPTNGLNPSNAQYWDVEQVCEWLEQANFGQFAHLFREQNITGDVLVDLNYSLLKEIGVHLVGDRARILASIKRNLGAGGTSIVTDSLSPKTDDRRGQYATSPNRPQKNRHAFSGLSPGSPKSSELSELDSGYDGRNQASPTSSQKRKNSLTRFQNIPYPMLAPRSSSINKEPKVSPLTTKSNFGDIHSVRYVSLDICDC
jgi:hypothetical protein